MDLEQVRADFKAGIMLSRSTIAKVLEATELMEETLGFISVADHKDAENASDCLGRVAAL